MDTERSSPRSTVDRGRLGLRVLHETDHELVVIKPTGMATELTSDPKGVSLLSRVRSAVPRDVTPRLPHRLDRVTRGIVVAALSDDAIRFHNERLSGGAWTKVYLARVRRPLSYTFDNLIGTHRLHLRAQDGRATVVRSGGKRAITEILAVAAAPDRDDEGHVLLRLHTGRYHQVRASMAYLGAPLVGDWLYDPAPEREERRFYLEHTALRFVPFGADRPLTIHLRDDPDRDALDPALRAVFDRRLAEWEEGDAEKR